MELVTRADKERLEAQLAALRALDKQLVERIAEARAQGDLRENADYHASREDKSINDAKIRELEARLAGVQVVDQSEMPTDMVFLGAEITIRDETNGRHRETAHNGRLGEVGLFLALRRWLHDRKGVACEQCAAECEDEPREKIFAEEHGLTMGPSR